MSVIQRDNELSNLWLSCTATFDDVQKIFGICNLNISVHSIGNHSVRFIRCASYARAGILPKGSYKTEGKAGKGGWGNTT